MRSSESIGGSREVEAWKDRRSAFLAACPQTTTSTSGMNVATNVCSKCNRGTRTNPKIEYVLTCTGKYSRTKQPYCSRQTETADCQTRWHHTCLEPPMPDKELLDRLKESKNKLNWRCRKCLTRANQDAPIVIDDDDDDEIEFVGMSSNKVRLNISGHFGMLTQTLKASNTVSQIQPKFKQENLPPIAVEPPLNAPFVNVSQPLKRSKSQSTEYEEDLYGKPILLDTHQASPPPNEPQRPPSPQYRTVGDIPEATVSDWLREMFLESKVASRFRAQASLSGPPDGPVKAQRFQTSWGIPLTRKAG
jgi:hypothetical protein